MAISTQVNNDLYKRALSEAEKERLAAIAKQQGAGAASSLALQMANAQNTTTPTPKGATTPTNTAGAVGSTNTNLAAQQAQAAIAAQQAAAGSGGNTAGKPMANGTGFLAADGRTGKITYGLWGERVTDAEGKTHWLDSDHGYFKSSNGYIYDTNEATDYELARHGLYRTTLNGKTVAMPIPAQNAEGFARNMDKLRDAHIAQTGSDVLSPDELYGPDDSAPSAYAGVSGGTAPRDGRPTDVGGVTNYALDYTSRTPTPSSNPTPSPNPTPAGNPSQQAKPLPKDQQVQTQTVSRVDPTAFQTYLDQWSYGPAPEWTGGQDETWKEVYNYDYGEAPTWEGSQYDRMRDDALAAYGEKWQGSEYQKQRDEALRRAQDMQWNYDPNTDPVWQALQKQYRREGDRATQEALAQAAMRTGGLANSYAVTAASQAGDYYAAQLSDRLPQLYQDAYQRYLQEFQRQMGISDQYAGFDDREYARWADQQGKNLDLADRYNKYGQQEYGQYQDRLGQFNTDRNFQYGLNRDYVSDAERANQTAYSRYLDSLDQYNRDRAMSYEQFRDAVGDMRYDDETQYARNYQAQRDAISDQRYDQQWAQQLREYADSQNWKAKDWAQYLREYEDKMSWQEREWAYQQYRDAVGDNRWERQYADQRSDTMYNRALQEDQTAYQRALYDQEYADQRGDTAWEQGYKQTAYNDEMERSALNYLNTNGIVTGRYAEILGVPDGTTYEQYYSRYLGGGSTSPFDETEIPSGTTPSPPGGGDEGDGDDYGGGVDLSKVGNKATQDWVALDDNQRVSWQELYTLVENGDVEEYYQNGKYYYRWKNMKVPEGKPKETTPKVVYENRGGR